MKQFEVCMDLDLEIQFQRRIWSNEKIHHWIKQIKYSKPKQ